MSNMGRPPIYKNRKVLPLPIEDSLLQALKEIAYQERTPASEIIQKLIADYVAKHSKGNPAFPLEKWMTDSTFIALPTLGETLQPQDLDKHSDEELKLLVHALRGRLHEVKAATERRRWIVEW